MKGIKILILFLLVFITGCVTEFYIPEDEFTIQGYTDVENFDHYTVEVGRGLNPNLFSNEGVKLRFDGKRNLRNEAIAKVDVGHLSDGLNTVRITVYDKSGNTFYEYSYIYVDNDRIIYPEENMNFELVKESPANRPPIYYIIEEKPGTDEDGVVVIMSEEDNEGSLSENTAEEVTKRKIPGSKINIVGKRSETGSARYKIDYTYDPDKRVWFTKGIELMEPNEGDVLATLDLKELKYEGGLTIRLRKFNEVNLASTETVTISVHSDLYSSLDLKFRSELQNLGNVNLRGLLTIGIDRFSGAEGKIENGDKKYSLNVGEIVAIGGHNLILDRVGAGGEVSVQVDGLRTLIARGSTIDFNGLRITNYESFYDPDDIENGSAVLLVVLLDPVVEDLWDDYKLVMDKVPFTLLRRQNFDLSRLNLNDLKVDEPGKYRIYARFDYRDESRVSYYLFDVIERTGGDYCTDNTLRNACSTKSISYYCGSDLQLAQNCQFCGCPSGFLCQTIGRCSAIF